MLKINDIAPGFELPIDVNKFIKLSDYLDRFVVLYFYPKDDTPGCSLEAKDFNSLKTEFDKLNAVIIGISKDDIESHKKFSNKYCLDFNLAFDNIDICEQYDAYNERSIFGKKYMTVSRITYLISPKGTIAHIWSSVDTNRHAEAVLNKIKDL